MVILLTSWLTTVLTWQWLSHRPMHLLADEHIGFLAVSISKSLLFFIRVLLDAHDVAITGHTVGVVLAPALEVKGAAICPHPLPRALQVIETHHHLSVTSAARCHIGVYIRWCMSEVNQGVTAVSCSMWKSSGPITSTQWGLQ